MKKENLYRFFNGETTLAEERAIKAWTEESDDNLKTFFKERRMFDAIILQSEKVYERDSLKTWKVVWNISKVAAVILVFFTATLSLYRQINDNPTYNTVSVPQGQRVNLTLSDGTTVWLNASTTMIYPQKFSRRDRTVKIDGEAYFEVSHNKRKPFIVETSKANIEVLGTKFYVEAYSKSEEFITSLIEGKVKVRSQREEVLLETLEKVALKKGQMIRSEINDFSDFTWKEGLISFRNKSFLEIIKEFEKYYDVKIFLETSIVEFPVFTGKFRVSDGVDYALKVLQSDMKFMYTRESDGEIIRIKYKK